MLDSSTSGSDNHKVLASRGGGHDHCGSADFAADGFDQGLSCGHDGVLRRLAHAFEPRVHGFKEHALRAGLAQLGKNVTRQSHAKNGAIRLAALGQGQGARKNQQAGQGHAQVGSAAQIRPRVALHQTSLIKEAGKRGSP